MSPIEALRAWFLSIDPAMQSWVATFWRTSMKLERSPNPVEFVTQFLDSIADVAGTMRTIGLVVNLRATADYTFWWLTREPEDRWVAMQRENVRLGVEPMASTARIALEARPRWNQALSEAIASWERLKETLLTNTALDAWARDASVAALDADPVVKAQADELRELIRKLREGEN